MDVQTLVGNSGGYIGLCLGYSLLQIPNLILFVMKKLKKYSSELRSRQNSIGMPGMHTSVHKNHLNNIPESKANNPEKKTYEAVQLLQIQLRNMTETMETLRERMNHFEIELSTQTVSVHRRRNCKDPDNHC